MASLQKIVYVRWVDSQGFRVPAGTPGAKKIREKSAKWYACWKEGRKQVRIALATDKSASQAMLVDLLRNKEQVKAGIIDPYKQHLDRPISEHVEEYLNSITRSGKARSEKYLSEKRRILGVIIGGCRMKSLEHLAGETVDAYMDSLSCSVATKRVHHSAIHAFAAWLVQKKMQICTNWSRPLEQLRTLT